MDIYLIEVRGPGGPPQGHAPIQNWWRVSVVLTSGRSMGWSVVLPLAEVYDALKTVQITEYSIEIPHPAFEADQAAARGTPIEPDV